MQPAQVNRSTALKHRLSTLLIVAVTTCCFYLTSPVGALGQAQTTTGNSVERWNRPAGGVGPAGNGPVSVIHRAPFARPAGIHSGDTLNRTRSKRRPGVILADPVHADDLSIAKNI